MPLEHGEEIRVAIPTFDQMLRPILSLAVSEPVTRRSATEAMEKNFNLTDEEKASRIPSGSSTYAASRAGWAMTFLTKGGLLEKVAPKQYRATERGKAFLSAHPESINVKDLQTIDGWDDAWQRKKPSGGDEGSALSS